MIEVGRHAWAEARLEVGKQGRSVGAGGGDGGEQLRMRARAAGKFRIWFFWVLDSGKG